MARAKRGRGTKAKKPVKSRKPAKRVKAAARKPAKRGAAKPKTRKARAKPPVKRAAAPKARAKKLAPKRPPRQKLEVDVIDVETIEEVAPGIAVVTDYEIVGVHPVSGDKKDDGPGSENT